jgi:NAD(P)-dependent dehydrogenase (short-subunit alcohol dehydrogenase family)
LALAKEGAKVVGYDVAKKIEYPDYEFGSNKELQSLKKQIEKLGGEALVFVGDVRDDKAITLAVEETIKKFGRIDVLFNNAGICAMARSIRWQKRLGTL